MKLIFLIALLFVPSAALAAGPAEEPTNDELVALERFLSLSDAELDAMLAAIQRVRAMTPEQRAEFSQRIVSYRGLPPDQREQIRAGWGWISVQDRNDWRRMMQGLSPEERARVHARLDAAAPQDRPRVKHEILETWRGH